ncbi:hypothetical protein BB776_05705 [Planococcus salinarum]|uniref:PH domain-containing protein n=1 Tax=Planococcus salinarum TaxID=622695 RepID=A0ABX3D1Y5_9BACL|nr:hypothetical protein BB776_05705 [Planococcus salinarum]
MDKKRNETRIPGPCRAMYSDARGSLKITSKDPKVYPSMVYNYLSTEQDRREWVEAIRVSRKIMSQPAMSAYNSGEISPGAAVSTDEEILEWVANDAETALHPSCTAKMGPASDPMAVVDPLTMKVHGLDNVRVPMLPRCLRYERQYPCTCADARRKSG